MRDPIKITQNGNVFVLSARSKYGRREVLRTTCRVTGAYGFSYKIVYSRKIPLSLNRSRANSRKRRMKKKKKMFFLPPRRSPRFDECNAKPRVGPRHTRDKRFSPRFSFPPVGSVPLFLKLYNCIVSARSERRKGRCLKSHAE